MKPNAKAVNDDDDDDRFCWKCFCYHLSDFDRTRYKKGYNFICTTTNYLQT